MKIHSINKRAKYDYEFLDKYESGISLKGSEVKSIKLGDVDLSGSYVIIDKNGNAQWLNGNIKKYNHAIENHDEKRTRQLLFNKKELKKIQEKIQEKRLTIIPYIIFSNKKGKIKLEVHISKGKTTHDKRETIKQRDLKRLNK